MTEKAGHAATSASTTGLRAQVLILSVLALMSAINGAWMLATPEAWFWTIAGVPDTGPFNAHFVRDVGVTYLVLAFCLAVGAIRPALAFPFLVPVALWHVGHAALHLWDIAAERLPYDHLVIDSPGVFMPAAAFALVALWTYPQWRQGRTAS